MSMWTVKMPGEPEREMDTMTLQAWANAGKVTGDTVVIENSTQERWNAKQIAGVFSKRDWLVALLLSVFLGVLGVDRFYLGKVGTGILKLLLNLATLFTFGLIWVVIDIILIATKKLSDKEGLKLA
ncbi:MAG: TM2 domain-containing protein [Microbacteriaceae bacterium]|nr:TM2 domain-containing protein [Microbacteriaceae bacterium]MDR9444323.1 TM2 domain-containing protein [Microbacteriaceae bacterium]